MELGSVTPGTGFDRLVVNGQATLGGALTVAMINGFRPAIGDAFAVMRYASRTGTFTSTNGLTLGNGFNLVPDFGPTDLTLTVTGAALSQPALTFSRSTDSLFHLQLQGQPGMNYRLEASFNLVDWTSLLTTNSPSGLVDFTDSTSMSIPLRFYRAVTP